MKFLKNRFNLGLVAVMIIMGGVFYGRLHEQKQEFTENLGAQNYQSVSERGSMFTIGFGKDVEKYNCSDRLEKFLGESSGRMERINEFMERPRQESRETSRYSLHNRWDSNSSSNDCLIFEVTAYNNGVESTGKRPGDEGYGITATGSRATEGRTIAADFRVLPPGSRVIIDGIGERVVEDSGGAIKGYKLDVFMESKDDCDNFGVQKRKVIILKKGDSDG